MWENSKGQNRKMADDQKRKCVSNNQSINQYFFILLNMLAGQGIDYMGTVLYGSIKCDTDLFRK